MKQLLVVRHAKSDWGTSSQDDWDRPLSERGIRDAPRVGKTLRRRSLMPDVIITSDAVRARSTARAAAKAAGYTRDIVQDHGLYLATPGAIVTVLNGLPDDTGIVMIVGHNPGLEDLISQLSGEHHGMPTAAIVQLELPITRWGDLDLSIGAVVGVCWSPKD